MHSPWRGIQLDVGAIEISCSLFVSDHHTASIPADFSARRRKTVLFYMDIFALVWYIAERN